MCNDAILTYRGWLESLKAGDFVSAGSCLLKIRAVDSRRIYTIALRAYCYGDELMFSLKTGKRWGASGAARMNQLSPLTAEAAARIYEAQLYTAVTEIDFNELTTDQYKAVLEAASCSIPTPHPQLLELLEPPRKGRD
jgi:hypothetical protein